MEDVFRCFTQVKVAIPQCKSTEFKVLSMLRKMYLKYVKVLSAETSKLFKINYKKAAKCHIWEAGTILLKKYFCMKNVQLSKLSLIHN